MIFFVENIPN